MEPTVPTKFVLSSITSKQFHFVSSLSLSDTVLKSCTYKAFCEKAHGSNSGAKMECCFANNCNGPHKSHSHSHGDHHHSSAGALAYSPVMLITTLLLRLVCSKV